jgi:hypothetical protein
MSGSDFLKESANLYNQQSIFIKQRKIGNLLFLKIAKLIEINRNHVERIKILNLPSYVE